MMPTLTSSFHIFYTNEVVKLKFISIKQGQLLRVQGLGCTFRVRLLHRTISDWTSLRD